MKISEILGGYRVSGKGYQQARKNKARKLVQIIQQQKTLVNADILDVGCGSGLLLTSIKALVPAAGHLIGVDMMAPRQEADFDYRQVTDTSLPFEDASFDVVISNHVIEHVGDDHDQTCHLAEIYRVLKPDGIFYMACPNKWGLVEPHYNLAFLSWLPRSAAGWWVRSQTRNRVRMATAKHSQLHQQTTVSGLHGTR